MSISRLHSYKEKIGFGSTNDTFYFKIKRPSLDETSSEIDDLSILVHEIKLPEPRAVETETIQYRGEEIKLPKSRGGYGDLSIKFVNPENFNLRRYFEVWMEACSLSGFNVKNKIEDVKSNAVVHIYERDMKTIKTSVAFYGMFVKGVDIFTLKDDDLGDLIENEITFSIDSFNYLTDTGSSNVSKLGLEQSADTVTNDLLQGVYSPWEFGGDWMTIYNGDLGTSIRIGKSGVGF